MRTLSRRAPMLLVVAALTCACGATRVPAAPPGAPAALAPAAAGVLPDSAALVAGDWRLSSSIFGAAPAEGYPIRFGADGTVETENLAGVTGWLLVGDLLLLHDAQDRAAYRFEWRDEEGVFEHRLRPNDASSPVIRLARRDAPAPSPAAVARAHRARLLRDLTAPAPEPLVLPGATVATEDDARRIALQAYFETGGLRALQAARVTDVFPLGADVPGFAKRGDHVWEVRIHEHQELSAVIWIHAESAAHLFLFPPEGETGSKDSEP